ncbi:hypothetical protein QTP70_001843 [Hemibagrus guttatus]|uniref:PiggyBac transposable element-derived protein domain-containing protein n=1 Tax=Hemibagrus guttatus TaxID=175788 RepID=A0AAE0VDS1_9TELE|nr:hypothetical protein QTP70_001843 [Hemibagrus guttatus]KAK3574369.1 hypothetical protein QTP86_005792 [Hemibagrus guttatus]
MEEELSIDEQIVSFRGATTDLSEKDKAILGHEAAVVNHLYQQLHSPNHKVFFDNVFTTYNLLELLAAKKIYAAGTARVSRFAKPPLMSDKEMSKRGRGNHYQVRSRDGKVVLTKWFDNRTVVISSNFVGVGKDQVERWDQQRRSFVKIQHPECVMRYNQAMGGVDKLNHLISQDRY